ncbi:Retrovirus-related Pol polyprotein from type-2 retrotransposable element R2DM, partial [Araneus ventricosus]
MIRTRNSLQFRCSDCELCFRTAVGLNNHMRCHKKQNASTNITQLEVPVPRRRTRRNRNRILDSLPETEENGHIEDPLRQLAPAEDSGFITGSSQEITEDEDLPVAEKYLRLFRVIQDGEPTPEAFTLFKELVRQFCNDAKSTIEENSNTQRRVVVNNNDLPSVADDAQAIQILFKRNRKRAIREILRNVAERCMISPTYIFDYFSTAWGPATSDPTYYTEAEDGRVEVLDRIFSVKEVATKLKKADNTSPGPDRITYHHWRQIDPSAKTLTTIFNLCLEFKKIPEDWKSATTILIPKDGDAADPRNWRPIALSNTLYKLFTKCLAARLSDWCSRYDVLSHCQKGFLPHDGVLEHNYALKNAELIAREKKREICIAWVDVSNAFGALPHSAIFDALHNAKVGQGFVELVRDIYCGSTTQVLTNGTKTDEIPILSFTNGIISSFSLISGSK